MSKLPPPDEHEAFVSALQIIALGRPDNGRPLAAETARQLARSILDVYGVGYSRKDVGVTVATVPHFYAPSAMHQGDCQTCGNVRDHPLHRKER